MAWQPGQFHFCIQTPTRSAVGYPTAKATKQLGDLVDRINMPPRIMTTCWKCKTIQKVGFPCMNCRAPIDCPYDDLPTCSRCNKKKPDGIACPFCAVEEWT